MLVSIKDNIELIIIWPEDVPRYVLGDPGRIRQIIFNLVSNAIKFTEEGSVIVSVEALGQHEGKQEFYISVQDTGIGIAEDKLDHIFGKFSQAEETTTRNFGGTGLGLSICSKFVDKMEGNIGVESTLGEGSKFWFTIQLPLSTQKEVECDRIKDKEESKDIKYRDVHILLVEDNPTNQMIATEILEDFGCNVTVACNGVEAVERVTKQAFDLIFMDCQMPIMDGFEATDKIRKIEEQKQASASRIVAFTANAIKGDRDKCLAAGMDDYVSKPVKKDRLGFILLKWLPIEKKIEPESKYNDEDSDYELVVNGIDETIFSETKVLMGEKLPIIVKAYLENGKKYIKQAEEGLANDDAYKIAEAAHPFKSSSASLGVMEVSRLASEIEKEARELDRNGGNLSSLDLNIQALKEAFIKIEKPLRKKAAIIN